VFNLLVENGFYETALSLGKLKDHTLDNVFQHLTQQCLDQQSKPGFIMHRTEEWAEAVREYAPNQQAWYLLEQYLNQYDSSQTNYRYHRTAVETIFSKDARIQIPVWLKKSYTTKHPSGLLRCFMKFNLLEDACSLVVNISQLNQYADVSPMLLAQLNEYLAANQQQLVRELRQKVNQAIQ
jgi:hypothetical protein